MIGQSTSASSTVRFNCLIHHKYYITGQNNVVLDTLSCINAIQMPVITMEELSGTGERWKASRTFERRINFRIKRIHVIRFNHTTLLRLLKRNNTIVRPRNSEEMNLRRRAWNDTHPTEEPSNKNSFGRESIETSLTRNVPVFSVSVAKSNSIPEIYPKRFQRQTSVSKSIWISSTLFRK